MDLAAILSGLITGGAGIAQLTGGQNAAQSAAIASPFQGQYAGYQGQVQPQIGAIQGQQGATNASLNSIIAQLTGQAGGNSTISGAISGLGSAAATTGGLNTNAGSVPTSVSGSAGNLQQQIAQLSGNYLNDPVIQSELQTGTENVTRTLNAQGMGGSGAQQVELAKYGEQFAEEQYQTQLGNLLQESSTEFGQNVGATQLGAQLQGQTFSQGLQQQQGVGSLLQGQGGLAATLSQLQTGALGTAGQLATGQGNLELNSQQGLLNSLEALSGATTGSPSTAGIINSTQFGNTQQAIANLGSGINGILSGAQGFNISSLLSSIGNGGGGTDLGGILSSLGNSGFGSDIMNAIGQFSGGGSVSNIFGNSVTDLGSIIGDSAGGTGILGDVGSVLGGIF